MECFTGEDKLRLLLLAALSCNLSSVPSGGAGGSVGGTGGGSNGGGGGGAVGGSSAVLNISSHDLDRYGEQIKAAHPDLDISAIKYVHQLRYSILIGSCISSNTRGLSKAKVFGNP